MSKVRIGTATLLSAALAALPAVGHAGPVQADGRFTPVCEAGEPSMLVRVTGFKTRTGIVRVQSYGGDPAHWYDKGSYLKRIEVRVPPVGALDVCVPVPAPGRYAISVRHDIDGAGHAGHGDGGGMSGNPHVSLFDLMLKRKPAPDQVAVAVPHGVKLVPVVLNYVSGMSFGPVSVN